MPFVEIKLIESELSKEKVEELIEGVTDLIVSLIGENIRSVTPVLHQLDQKII